MSAYDIGLILLCSAVLVIVLSGAAVFIIMALRGNFDGPKLPPDNPMRWEVKEKE